jgi:hypothetical protein
MGPPDAADPALCVVTNAGVIGEALGVDIELPGAGVPVAGARGRVSSESVRKQDARTKENEAGVSGSCVEV